MDPVDALDRLGLAHPPCRGRGRPPGGRLRRARCRHRTVSTNVRTTPRPSPPGRHRRPGADIRCSADSRTP